jgi:hypothetical protein
MAAPLGPRGSDARKTAVRKYFRRTPHPREAARARQFILGAGAAAVLGVSLLLVGVPALAVMAAGVALVTLVQGLQQLAAYRRGYAAAEPKPTDEEMDRTLDEDLTSVAGRAMQRLGLTDDQLELHSADATPLARYGAGRRRLAEQGRGPLVVFGPAARARGCSGADRVWRFTAYDVMVICPTGHQLAIYECVLDFASGWRKNEETHEYHYADVVAVSTATRPTGELAFEPVGPSAYSGAFGGTMTREFQIIVSSGDRSAIAVSIYDDDRPDRRIVLQESGIDRVAAVVRDLLRAKRARVAPAP